MRCLVSLFVFLFIVAGTRAAEPAIELKDLPRVPPTEPQDALKTFQLKQGFRLELVAAEPLVVDPIALSFDENGRLFVVEMRDYSERRDDVPHPGRIRLLEDTDGDGRFDQSTVFADNLAWPTAVFCYGGGVFVGATPDILFLKDTDGDGKADVREVAFTGFAAGVERLNVQALLNSFNWGLDNRIHGVTAPSGGKVTSPKNSTATPVELRGRDFAFDPRTFALAPEAGGGQHGMSFDDTGRRFTCHNSDHVRLFMYDDRYAARNPFYAMPTASLSIAADGPSAEVFRISPDEPWRVIRTKWRVAGQVPGPIEGGGRASGYFTSATGITIYRGNAWPKEFLGDAFIADCGSNLVHRKKLRPNGVRLVAERPTDEQKTEFIASTDNWFRPVQFANAPDGCLYIADMYREVIEHPWSLPESIKKHLDLNSGNDRGRIYRIVPDGFKQPKPPRLGGATTAELVKTLEHANGWHRDTAARLLYERQDKNAAHALRKLLAQSRNPLGRLHALHALDGLGALTEVLVLKAFDDADAVVREHAIRLSEKFLQPAPSGKIWTKLRALTADPSERVRYQLAFTLGETAHPERASALAEIARRNFQSEWVRAAVLSSTTEGASALFRELAGHAPVRGTPAGREFLRQLVQIVGARNKTGELTPVFDFIGKLEKPALAFALVRALGEGLWRVGGALPRADAGLKEVFTRAARTAADSAATEATRTEAIQLLGLMTFGESADTLLPLLDLRQPQSIQLAALNTLGRFTDERVAGELINRWATFSPRLRSEALNVLLARPERATALLQAIEAGTMRPAELSSPQIKLLRNHREPAVRQRATRVLPLAPPAQRQQAITAYEPSLTLKGDAAGGRTIYLERCASCHRLGGDGFALGPDLVTVRNAGKEKLLTNILDPNREVAPQLVAYLIETKDDESLLGIIASETAASVTVRQAFGKETVIPRPRIREMRSQGQSLMPEELETGLTPQQRC